MFSSRHCELIPPLLLGTSWLIFESFAAAAEVAVTLGTVFYCLLAHQEVYSRLVTELRHMDHAQSKNLSAHKTPYL